MRTPEGEPTTYKIFSNGDRQPEFPGVSDESVFDWDKQIYVPREGFNGKGTTAKPLRQKIHSARKSQF